MPGASPRASPPRCSKRCEARVLLALAPTSSRGDSHWLMPLAAPGLQAGARRPVPRPAGSVLEVGPAGAGLGAVEQVQPGSQVRSGALAMELEFLRALLFLEVAPEREHVAGQAVHVEHGPRIPLPPGADRAQPPARSRHPVDRQRGALAVQVQALRGAAADVVAAGVERRLLRFEQRPGHRQPASARRAGAVAVAVPGQAHLEVVARRPQPVPAGNRGVACADLAAGGQVAAVSVAVVAGQRHAGADLAHRQVEHQPGVAPAVVAGGQRGRAAEVRLRRARDQLDRPAQGVASVQGALRTAQHLHPLDVEHVEQGALGACEVHVVEVDAHARLGAPDRVELADAADVRGDAAVEGAGRVDHQVRGDHVEHGDVGRAARLQLRAVDRGHRLGHVQKRLGPPARGHHHAVEFARTGRFRGLQLRARGGHVRHRGHEDGGQRPGGERAGKAWLSHTRFSGGRQRPDQGVPSKQTALAPRLRTPVDFSPGRA